MATERKVAKLVEKSLVDESKYDLCLRRIFACLPIADRFKMREVCKRWKKISEMPWEDITRLNCSSSWTWPGTYVFEVTLPRLEQVLRLCGNNLTHLDFSEHFPLEDCNPMSFDADAEFFTVLATHCPKLQILDMYFLIPMPDGIAYMADNYNQITDLRIYDYDSKCNNAMSSFFKKASKLEAITFYGDQTHRTCIAELPVTIKKIYMDVIFDDFYDLLFLKLEKCRKLESFRVGKCSLRNYEFPGITRALSENAMLLKEIEVSNDISCPFRLQKSHFSEFKNLQELKLNCNNVVSDDLLELIGKSSPQLKSVLFTTSTKVTDRGINFLPNLERINLTLLPAVKGEFFAKMSNLKEVRLGYCGITDRSLHSLLDTAVNLEFIDFRSDNHHNTKEFILHASDVVKRRKMRIPLEIVLEVEDNVKEFKRDLFRVRKAT